MNVTISHWDYLIIGVYILFVISLGFYFNSKQRSERDYFLAGRSLLWPVIGFSLFASNMGSISLVGLAEAGYKGGFAVFSYEWMAAIVLILFAIFFLPFYLKNKIYTIPEFLERRYGRFARVYFSIVTVALNVFIDIASGLFAGAVVVKMAFPSLSLVQIIWIISVIAAFYTLLGGLSSVVYTDVVQAVLLIGSSVIITIVAYYKIGGWESIVAGVDSQMLKIIRPVGDPDLPWPGLFSGVFLLGFYFWVTNQFITQRALASKNVMQGQWGAMFAGFLKLSALFIMVLPGVIAILLYPNLTDAKDAYPTLLFSLLPTGILGLALSGFIGALMSSVDSGLNAASTLITFDFYKKLKPKSSTKETLIFAKILIVFLMIVAALWAPQIVKFPSFWDYLQMVLSFICPPVVALFIFGLFWKKVNTNGANAAIVVGIMLSIFSIIYKIYSNFNVGAKDILPHYLYLAGIIFAICSIVLIGASLMFPSKEEKNWDNLIWTPAYYHSKTAELRALPFYKNYRYHAIGLIVLIALLLLWF